MSDSLGASEGDMHGYSKLFVRMISPASTAAPETPKAFLEHPSYDPPALDLSHGPERVIDERPFPSFLRERQEAGDVEYDSDGMPWVKTVGVGIEQQRLAYNERLERLQDPLDEVKNLYFDRYGEHVDSEDDDVLFDADGTEWVNTEGVGIDAQRREYDAKWNALWEQLGEVKALYAETEEGVFHDADGTEWVRTEGEGIDAQRRDYTDRVDDLWEQLSAVKELYAQKFGEGVDHEEGDAFHDAQGTAWLKTTGVGVDEQRRAYFARVDRLWDQLLEVKDLYLQKYGESVDGEADGFHDADGTRWVRITGGGVDEQRREYNERLEALSKGLAEFKALYASVYGHDVDE